MDLKRLRAELVLDEGVRAKAYLDTVGKVTIGVGRNLTDVGLSRAEIEVLFQNDIDRVVGDAHAAFPWFAGLDPVRQLVVCNMVFNLGVPKLKKFKATIAAIEARQYEQAADQMLKSLWAKQVGKRARRLAQMMRTGMLQPLV